MFFLVLSFYYKHTRTHTQTHNKWISFFSVHKFFFVFCNTTNFFLELFFWLNSRVIESSFFSSLLKAATNNDDNNNNDDDDDDDDDDEISVFFSPWYNKRGDVQCFSFYYLILVFLFFNHPNYSNKTKMIERYFLCEIEEFMSYSANLYLIGLFILSSNKFFLVSLALFPIRHHQCYSYRFCHAWFPHNIHFFLFGPISICQ